MTTAQHWIADVKASHDLESVARELGMQRLRGGRYGPCQSCGGDADSSGRGAVRLDPGGRWFCNACGKDGDVVDLVALSLGEPGATSEVRRWFDVPEPRRATVHREPDPVPARRPTKDEADRVWKWCSRTAPEATRSFLEGRGVDPCVVGRLCRVVPRTRGRNHPEPYARGWPADSLALPLYSERGHGRGQHCRTLHRTLHRSPKAMRMEGVAVGGLLLASPAAVHALRDRACPEKGWLVVEGDLDYLAAAHANPDVGVLGLTGSGAWSPVWGDVLPGPVFLRCDVDNGGDTHTARVLGDLPRATDIRPPPGHPQSVDVDELDPCHRTLAAMQRVARTPGEPDDDTRS